MPNLVTIDLDEVFQQAGMTQPRDAHGYLADTLEETGYASHSAIASAIRAAKPVEEPTKLAAVIEDKDGDLWIRGQYPDEDNPGTDDNGPWMLANDRRRATWEHITSLYGPVTVRG